MPKLITVNVEGQKHYSTIKPFIEKESPDILCLQEVDEALMPYLESLGYQTSFTPMCVKSLKEGLENEFVMGVAIATKVPHTSHYYYYHGDRQNINKMQSRVEQESVSFAYVMAECQINEKTFNVATTHVMDTGIGAENEFQIYGVKKMLLALTNEPTHLICGDFNMPRGYNNLYQEFTAKYQDQIPAEYSSSLDKSLHRLGNVKIDRPIFEKFMVDYIFTQAPYNAKHVRLQFGVSDHAAVIAEIDRG